jgi:glycosyltransferase involved in cell wall biosynthesis
VYYSNCKKKEMNLFIIPSWYPSDSSPLSGIFIKEQVEVIADLAPQVSVLVSTWGHGLGGLSPRSVKATLQAIRWYRHNRGTCKISKTNNLYELFSPTLTWSGRLPFGGIQQLISANRKNLQMAIATVGDVNVIHAHVSYPAGYIASVLSMEYGIPFVLTEHMGPFPFPDLMRDGSPLREISEAFERAAISVAVSPSLAERIASFGYRKPLVIPNLVDERRFNLSTPSTEKCIFFTLCGLNEQKGVDHLLHAIAQWNPPADQFEFRIGGEGPRRAEYEALAERLGISDRVCWLGIVSRDDAPSLFQGCHIYIMPSQHETFGIVYAEAIASGKPVIATRCGGPEFILNQDNGRLVEIGDIKGLVCVMSDMVQGLSSYSSRIIREDFIKRFSRQAVVSQLLAVYDQVVRKS